MRRFSRPIPCNGVFPALALSAVSLLAARRVGATLGGGTTLPAYFAVWFALRRLTGAGRRR